MLTGHVHIYHRVNAFGGRRSVAVLRANHCGRVLSGHNTRNSLYNVSSRFVGGMFRTVRRRDMERRVRVVGGWASRGVGFEDQWGKLLLCQYVRLPTQGHYV